MINNFVTNLQTSTFTVSTVTTSATIGTYVQLPSISCDEVILSLSSTGTALTSGLTITPGNNIITIPQNVFISLPTGPTRNSNVWFVSNTAAVAEVVGILAKTYDNNKAGPITVRGTAG